MVYTVTSSVWRPRGNGRSPKTLRRAAEQFLARHRVVDPQTAPWKPPVSGLVGWRGLTHEQVHEAALDDVEQRGDVERLGDATAGARRR